MGLGSDAAASREAHEQVVGQVCGVDAGWGAVQRKWSYGDSGHSVYLRVPLGIDLLRARLKL